MDKNSRAERALAGIRLQMAQAYIRDMEEFRNGDQNKFGRMVDGKGKGLGSEAIWVKNADGALSDSLSLGWYKAEALGLIERFGRMGHRFEEHDEKENGQE